MYPSNLQTNLRRREGAYGQTSLARAFVHNRQTGLSLVARSTFPRNRSDLEGDMKNVTPLRLGMFGVVWFGGGLAWCAYWFGYVRIPDSPMIIIDQEMPIVPRVAVLCGALMLIVSLVWAIASRLRRKRARS